MHIQIFWFLIVNAKKKHQLINKVISLHESVERVLHLPRLLFLVLKFFFLFCRPVFAHIPCCNIFVELIFWCKGTCLILKMRLWHNQFYNLQPVDKVKFDSYPNELQCFRGGQLPCIFFHGTCTCNNHNLDINYNILTTKQSEMIEYSQYFNDLFLIAVRI